jgi:cobalt-zinc-cadmium efflux system protein
VAHAHGAASAAGRNQRRLGIVLAMTSAYLVAEIAGAYLTGSLALLADAGHMFTDVGGLVLTLIAIKLAERAPTSRRTYGYYRVEILAAALNALALFAMSFFVLYEAYQRFQAPPPIAGGPMLVVALLGLLVNVASMLLLRDAASESLNMKGAYLEVMSDFIASIGVLISALVMLATGWYYADPIVSAAIGVFILPRTWLLLRDAVNVLLEGTPAGLDIASVRAAIEGVAGVASVHDLHAWALTSGVNALSAHVTFAPGADHIAVRHAIHERLRSEFAIHHITLQMEVPGEEQHEEHL